MTNKEDKMILAQSRADKLKWLEELLESNNFGLWFALTKILLKYPISEGGISTDDIDFIWQKHLKKSKDDNQLN